MLQKKFIFIKNIFNFEDIYISLHLKEATNALKKWILSIFNCEKPGGRFAGAWQNSNC